MLDSVGTNTDVLPEPALEPEITAPAPAPVEGSISPLAVCEEVIRRFETALRLDPGSVMKPDAVAAFDKAVRLRAFLLGDGEKGKATQAMTLEELQTRYANGRARGAALAEAASDALDGVTAEGDPVDEAAAAAENH